GPAKRLPMPQRAPPASAPDPVPPLAPRVLLAHGPEWRSRSRELERALGPAGYTVLEAYTGPEALQQARRSQPDAIILDTALPDGDAPELCRALRVDPDITASTPILVTTAGPATRQQVSDALRAGVDGTIESLGRIVRSAGRGSDTIGRVGRRELAVLAPYTNTPAALRLAQRLLETAAELAGGEAHGMRAGYAVDADFRTSLRDPAELISRARSALAALLADGGAERIRAHGDTPRAQG